MCVRVVCVCVCMCVHSYVFTHSVCIKLSFSLTCPMQYVSEVVIGAPYSINAELLDQFKVELQFVFVCFFLFRKKKKVYHAGWSPCPSLLLTISIMQSFKYYLTNFLGWRHILP